MSAYSNLLVLGGGGFLGSSLAQNLEADSLSRSQLDLSNFTDESASILLRRKYRYVAICAGITDVELCFKDPERSYQINVAGTVQWLEIMKKAKAIPIFFSSDYVFSPQDTPYKELDPRNPTTVYGQQKLQIEKYLESNFKEFIIFRTSKLMSKKMHPKSILTPILNKLKARESFQLFEDQWLNPVFVEDIADVMKKVIQQDISGVFHLGTKKIYSRLGLGRALAEHFGFDATQIRPGLMKQALISEPRPSYNTLNCQKIEEALGFKFTEVIDGLSSMRLDLK